MNSLPQPPRAGKKIRACAAAVEAALGRAGAVLTMGGEPTFVPLQPEGAEWSTAALGPTKLGQARRLARRLLEQTYPGGVVLETSGKQYPGEPLPRWALLIHRRADGAPLWRDPTLLRADLEAGSHRLADAARLVAALAARLAVDPALALSCRDPNGGPGGLVLPLDHTGTEWRSDDWSAVFASGEVPLFPGDSLFGLRLPLGGLGEGRLRRALTAEVKDGTLTIFIPPVTTDAYCLLVPRLEEALRALGLRDVLLAGYAPPPDPRLVTVGLASDPGVIEVNLAPAATWEAYAAHLAEIYAAARETGLCARKLQFNGRETGTGGGAHLLFGGPVGAASPFFALPALLPSMIRYWQRHPALSYAFSGQYMGPSSQAPRIDETSFASLYELEIACHGVEQFGSPVNLVRFDLTFRDLLMDRTGNTHRAEISVDKLWNPFAANGRLGLVELRAFETHPDAQALALTGLFVRAVLARLAAHPFRAAFVRWGAALHDTFFLPSVVWSDLAAICADLAAHGLPFDAAWLRPLWEWRFPCVGELPVEGRGGRKRRRFAVVFRQALEAWPLLGEQPSGGGTSRGVDASMDRVEARVGDAAALETGALLVNGLPCAFHATEDGGAAAGVRFRAFYFTSALQPHIAAHTPLLFEWVDRKTMTVLAAARWHVWNPRGQPYAAAPADEAEARARQAERWEPWSQTLGQRRAIPQLEFPPECRHTLDLRRYPTYLPHGLPSVAPAVLTPPASRAKKTRRGEAAGRMSRKGRAAAVTSKARARAKRARGSG